MTPSPASPVFGQTVTLKATVSETEPRHRGADRHGDLQQEDRLWARQRSAAAPASIVTTPHAAGTETITIAYGGDAADQPDSITFNLTVSPAQAALGLSNLNVTYDGSPHVAAVTTSPGGIVGVTVVYTQNGVVVAKPTHGGHLHGHGHAQ